MGGQDEAAEMIDDGGPAFPNPTTCATDGMALRDWFAGQALAGMLASGCHLDIDGPSIGWARIGTCYALADTAIQQRKAKPCTKAH